MDLEAQTTLRRRNQHQSLLLMIICQAAYCYNLLFLSPTVRIPNHTSVLTGEAWVLELLNGHPDRIHDSLGVKVEVFEAIVQVLVEHGFQRSRHGISVEQQLGIFLYTCVTGLGSRQVGERFQHSPTTITRYFHELLDFFSSAPFYTDYIKFPTAHTPISHKITHDPRFRHFVDCIGAIDGTHIRAFVPIEEHPNMRNRKGYLSQNCLFACDFDLMFTYAMTGGDGSSADATLWQRAHQNDLRMPPGKYLLADAGFGGSDTLLVPYRGVRYHLKEWRQGSQRPRNKEELFNLRHAGLRNVIERAFGVVKRQWRILAIPPEYDLDTQARVPAALCAIHNFIQKLDPDTFFTPEFHAHRLEQAAEEDEAFVLGRLGDGPPDVAERNRALDRRDRIAQAMWIDYCRELRERDEIQN